MLNQNPEYNHKPKTHRDDLSDDEATILAASEVIFQSLTAPSKSVYTPNQNDIINQNIEAEITGVSAEEFANILLELDGLDIFEQEVIIQGNLIDISVSSVGDMKIGYINGEYIYPGVNITFPFRASIPQEITVYVEGDRGDKVAPDTCDFGLSNLIVEFSPLEPDQDYILRVFRNLKT